MNANVTRLWCNPMHPLNEALPGPYVPVLVTRGALVAHRHTNAPPRCRTSQSAGVLFASQCPSGMILPTPFVRWCGTGGFQEQGQCFFIGLSCSILTIVFYYFSLSLLLSIVWYCGAGGTLFQP